MSENVGDISIISPPAYRNTDWPLGELITTRVLKLYLETFGSLDDLLADEGADLRAEALLNGGARGIAPAQLARVSRRAVSRLVAWEQQRPERDALRPADWRVILYCLTGARTLRQALERCVDCFEAIDWRCGKMTLRIRGDSADLELNSLRRSESPTSCLIDLFGVAEIHGLLRALIADPLPLERIWLDHDRQRFSGLDLPQLPAPLSLAAGWTGFSFPAVYLDHPVMSSMEALALRAPRSFLFAREPGMAASPEPVARRVRGIALEALREARRLPSFDEIVAVVGGSGATLRRRLAREATSYRDIKDSCRREVALDLLRRSDLPIEEIAARLDYCDSDAFRRAFRDWLGMSPSHYRVTASGYAAGPR